MCNAKKQPLSKNDLNNLLNSQLDDATILHLENFLIKNDQSTIIDFGNFFRNLLQNNKNTLNKITTQWFLSDESKLHQAVHDIVKLAVGNDIFLFSDKKTLEQYPKEKYMFAVRKSIGYLFSNPVSAASFVVSLIDELDKKDIKKATELLFDPLLISYSGKVKKYLESIKTKQSQKTKKVINCLFKKLEKYHQDLKSSWDIPELKPSQEQRETYHRFDSRRMSKAMEESKEQSIFSHLFPESILLYGRQGISYQRGLNQKEHTRSIINLQSHTVSTEFPSLEIINSEELNRLLFKLEVEKYKK